MIEVAVILLIISLIGVTVLALFCLMLMKIFKITVIKKGDIKTHFNESKKKLKIWHPVLLLRIASDEINANTIFFGVIIHSIVIEKLNKDEQFAIIDHELGHIKRWGDWFLLIYFVAPVVFIAYSIDIVMFNFPLKQWLGTLLLFVIFLILRFFKPDYVPDLKMKSEFEADRISAELGNAKALISALNKMEEHAKKQPLSGIQKHIGNFINFIITVYLANRPTHPSTKERIKKLEDFSLKAASQ